MEFDAGTWWLIGILLTFLIGALGWMVKRSLDKIERKLDSAATKAELEKEVGECKQQISEIQHTYTPEASTSRTGLNATTTSRPSSETF